MELASEQLLTHISTQKIANSIQQKLLLAPRPHFPNSVKVSESTVSSPSGVLAKP